MAPFAVGRLADTPCPGNSRPPSPAPRSGSFPFLGDTLREKELTGSRVMGLALSRRVVISARRAPRNTSPSSTFPPVSESGDALLPCARPGELHAETEAETTGEQARELEGTVTAPFNDCPPLLGMAGRRKLSGASASGMMSLRALADAAASPRVHMRPPGALARGPCPGKP